jgi:hypothetical protein
MNVYILAAAIRADEGVDRRRPIIVVQAFRDDRQAAAADA